MIGSILKNHRLFTLADNSGESNIFALSGYQVWCGSMLQDGGGRCHLYFSYWPEAMGFEAWVTHSQIGYAVAEAPEMPYRFVRCIFPGSGLAGRFDRDVTHNPTILQFDDGCYLYYTGNYSDTGEWWDHRNHQQIGVARSSVAGGELIRVSEPVIEHPGAVMTSNPSVCRMPDGRYLMIYKWVARKNPGPFFGPVCHAAAVAEHPLGPFCLMNEHLFGVAGVAFPGEDPFVFVWQERLFCLVKDNGRHYSPESKSLILFESRDGARNWERLGVALSRRLWLGGTPQEFFRMERPQLSFCSGQIRLFTAIKPEEFQDRSFSLNLKINFSIP